MNMHDWIEENLPSDSVIIDSGTAQGSDTEWFCKKFPKGKVYGFEPIPISFSITQGKTRMFDNVHLENVALGKKAEKRKFNFSSNRVTSSLLKPTGHLEAHPSVKFDKEITVDIINLDEWHKENSIEKVNLMWLDMQGYEWYVLNSSPEIMSKTDYIYTEVSSIEMYKDTVLYEDFKNWMLTRNFVVEKEFEFYDDGVGNVLFKRTIINKKNDSE